MSDVSITIAGSAGQGIETVADFMATVLKHSGYRVYSTREFMSRIRGGTNSLQLRVHNEIIGAFTLRSDIIVTLTEKALKRLQTYGRIQKDSIIILDENIKVEQEYEQAQLKKLPLKEKADAVGGTIYLNTIVAGAILSLFKAETKSVTDYFKDRFQSKGEAIIQNNIHAYQIGVQLSEEHLKDAPRYNIPLGKIDNTELLLSGTTAIALGAIAGGCNFLSSYPMSPSTGVLTYLSQRAIDYGIIIDQAEDEIAAINKGIGASYAGARSMVTTSGGGFALMNEGLSLAGITETPIVIHLAQRPGPATGLPTRSEQGELLYALHAGHGEFPRIIYSPGTPLEAFKLTKLAFNQAGRFQIPVIILTDQYLLDSTYTSKPFILKEPGFEKHIIKTEKNYQRYKLAESGVSPRGIPGYGNGLVKADSDEHDENGNITEDLILRTKMVNKRLKKLDMIKAEAITPTITNENADNLVISWGSNYYCVKEAIEKTDTKDIGLMHFSQVYPIHNSVIKTLEKKENLFIIENNATGQFSNLLHQETGIQIQNTNQLLKYDGLPFSVEQVTMFLKERMP